FGDGRFLRAFPTRRSSDLVWGDPEAPLTVVEFLDFECPFCARTSGMWKDLHEHFGDRVRYVARHLPLDGPHPHARAAAVAAEAADRKSTRLNSSHGKSTYA